MTRPGIRLLWVVLLVATCASLLPAAAWGAEPPANDKFESRQVLGPAFPGGTPVEVKASNAEATAEGESMPSLSPAGHSVWYEWEAESTGWTTIGVCEADFSALVGIFTGSEVDKLTPVISGNLGGSEGPDCVGEQRQFTFKAQAGTKYEIAVDGNVEPPSPVTEGEFTLRIEETPPPPNDDFAFADLFEGKITEESDGSRFYFAHAGGYNWNATVEEPSEPLDSPSDGATVWFTWTAPATAKYLFNGPCCGLGLSWDLYTGSSLEELNEVLVATGSAEVSVSAGTVFHIAVYGTPPSEGAEPAMASFQFNISANLPPLPGPTVIVDPPAPLRDITPPQTTIAKTKLLSASGLAKFWLSSNESGSFLCRLDKGAFKPCGSPRTCRHLKPGRHTFRAEAVDAAGNVDQSPAVAQIKIPHKQRRR